ncbi:MAG: ABC transporter transmembrane domain-containing protein, partial [Candidatus Hodarchaeales archaeon]
MSGSRISDIALLKKVFGLARPYYLHILIILLLSLLATPIALLMPIPIKVAVDSVIGAKPLPDFLTMLIPESLTGSKLGLLMFAAIFQVVIVLLSELQSLANYSMETVTGEKLTLSFRTKLFQHAKRLSLAFHDSKGSSDSIYRIQYDAPSIQWILVYGFIPFITSSVMFLSMIYVIFIINSKLALIAIIISPFLVIYARIYNKHMRSKYSHSKKLESSALNIIQEVLTSVRIVKAFGQEDRESDRFADMSEKGMKSRIKLVYFESGFGLLVNLTIAIGTSLVLYIGVKNVLAGFLSLGDLLLVIAYLALLYGP